MDEDTLDRGLEFLFTRAEFDYEQQYILTLNVDPRARYRTGLIPRPQAASGRLIQED